MNYFNPFLLATIVLFSHTLWARSPTSIWREDVESKKVLKNLALPQDIIWIHGLDDNNNPIPPKPDMIKAFRALTGLQIADSEQIIWNYKLNRTTNSYKTHKETNTNDTLAAIIQNTDLSFILFSSDEDTSIKLFKIEDKGLDLLIEGNKPQEFNPNNLRTWVAKNFGYEGVVIDHRGSEILVFNILGAFPKTKLQALGLANSKDSLILKENTRGNGLFQLVDADGPYGIFKVLVKDQQVIKVEPGTKLIFERGI